MGYVALSLTALLGTQAGPMSFFHQKNASTQRSGPRPKKVISQPAESTAHNFWYLNTSNLCPSLKGTKKWTEAWWSLYSWNNCPNASKTSQLETSDLVKDTEMQLNNTPVYKTGLEHEWKLVCWLQKSQEKTASQAFTAITCPGLTEINCISWKTPVDLKGFRIKP